MSFRVYMDVHVPAAITEGIRRRGIDALTAQDDGNDRADDEALLERSTELDRVFFTQDADLLSIAHRWQQDDRNFPGLVFAHQLGPGIGTVIDDLELILTVAEPEEIHNRVIYLPLK